MSDNKYGLPWVRGNTIIYDKEGNPLLKVYHTERHPPIKYMDHAIACVNLVGGKEPGECVVVNRGDNEKMKHNFRVHDSLIDEKIKLQQEITDLKAQLDTERANHAKTGKELFAGVNEMAAMMGKLAKAREGLEYIKPKLGSMNLYRIASETLTALDSDKADGLYEKIRLLFTQSETCGKCCPCPCRKTCPTEPLYQEIRTELGISQREDGCSDCGTCKNPKPDSVVLSGEGVEK